MSTYRVNTSNYISRAIVTLLICLTISLVTFAQEPNTISTPTPIPETNLIKNVIKDQVAIFSKPITIKKDDIKVIVPFASATLLSLAFDKKINKNLNKSSSFLKNSRNISAIGSAYATFGTAGAFYLVGKLSGNAKSKETGLLGLEALVDSTIVFNVIKAVTRRERPNKNFGKGDFFADGGNSFPSGHATLAWTMATVVAKKYSDKPIVKFASYGLATLVSITRVTGQKHFPTDVLVGSVIGYLIGHYVVKRHSTHP